MDSAESKTAKRRNLLLFAAVFVVWLAFDRFSKAYIAGMDVSVGQVFAGPFFGIFQCTLVHNTGAAWGMFANSTFLLGLVSLIVPFVLAVAAFAAFPKANALMIIGVALVCAGGIGNAIDRLTCGYVLDFIEFAFISFPVFNIADIGVTCGIPLFLIGLFAGKGVLDA